LKLHYDTEHNNLKYNINIYTYRRAGRRTLKWISILQVDFVPKFNNVSRRLCILAFHTGHSRVFQFRVFSRLSHTGQSQIIIFQSITSRYSRLPVQQLTLVTFYPDALSVPI